MAEYETGDRNASHVFFKLVMDVVPRLQVDQADLGEIEVVPGKSGTRRFTLVSNVRATDSNLVHLVPSSGNLDVVTDKTSSTIKDAVKTTTLQCCATIHCPKDIYWKYTGDCFARILVFDRKKATRWRSA